MSKIFTGFPVIVFLHVERRRRNPLKSPYLNPRVLGVVDGWSTLSAAESAAAGAVNPCKVHQVASAYFLLRTGGHNSAEVGSNLKKKHAKQICFHETFNVKQRVKNLKLSLVNVFHYLCLKWEKLFFQAMVLD